MGAESKVPSQNEFLNLVSKWAFSYVPIIIRSDSVSFDIKISVLWLYEQIQVNHSLAVSFFDKHSLDGSLTDAAGYHLSTVTDNSRSRFIC